jgi:hypothetical protein
LSQDGGIGYAESARVRVSRSRAIPTKRYSPQNCDRRAHTVRILTAI